MYGVLHLLVFLTVFINTLLEIFCCVNLLAGYVEYVPICRTMDIYTTKYIYRSVVVPMDIYYTYDIYPFVYPRCNTYHDSSPLSVYMVHRQLVRPCGPGEITIQLHFTWKRKNCTMFDKFDSPNLILRRGATFSTTFRAAFFWTEKFSFHSPKRIIENRTRREIVKPRRQTL